jgi:hypothetical protein
VLLDEGVDGLTPVDVRYPDHRDAAHRRMPDEHVLHLPAVDVHAARHHHVGLAVAQEHGYKS